MTPPTGTPDFARLVQEFFCDRLIRQQNVSAHTVAAYRDTFRLLLRFLQRRRQFFVRQRQWEWQFFGQRKLALMEMQELHRHG